MTERLHFLFITTVDTKLSSLREHTAQQRTDKLAFSLLCRTGSSPSEHSRTLEVSDLSKNKSGQVPRGSRTFSGSPMP